MSYSKQKIIINIFKIVFVFIVLIFIEIWAIKESWDKIMIDKTLFDSQKIAILGVFLFGFLFAVIYFRVRDWLYDFLDNAIYSLKNALAGNRGEKRTFKLLKNIFNNGEYRIYPNFKIPNTGFDNDVVIVGPKGIINIEIKNLKGTFEFIRGEEVHKIKEYFDCRCVCRLTGYRNPMSEIIRHTNALKDWLADKGYQDIPIYKFLLMTEERSITEIKSEHLSVYVIKGLDNLKDVLANIEVDPNFTQETCLNLFSIFGNNYLK